MAESDTTEITEHACKGTESLTNKQKKLGQNETFLYWAFSILEIFQFSSVTQLCPTLCDPIDCSTPGFPVHHQLPELAQTQVHQVSDAIHPSHPLPSPPPAFNLSQNQDFFPMSQFFASGGQSIGVSASASVLPMNIQC